MALPQPKRSEHFASDGPQPAHSSFADSLLAGSPPGAVWFTVCAWCERIKVHGRWVDGERALELMKVPPRREPSVTHGICPSCFGTVTSRGVAGAKSDAAA